MMKWVFGGFAAILALLFTYIAIYVGAFKDVSWKEDTQGPFYLVYLSERGPYHKIATVVMEVEDAFLEEGHSCPKTFGRFFDNPDTTDSDRLRSEGGCLFTEEPPFVPEGYDYTVLEERNYLVAEFSGAPSVGPLKVYPEAKKRLHERGKTEEAPHLEIYTLTPGEGVHTTYLFEL